MALAPRPRTPHILSEASDMTGETPMRARDRAWEPGRRPLVPSLTPAVVTTRGRRETNQDRVCALRTLIGNQPAVLLALADGIGGLPAGEQAAELALQVVSHYAHYVLPHSKLSPAGLRGTLGELLHDASRRIWRWARDQGMGGSAGSTLVCALAWDHHYLVAHAGDSRCYYVNHRAAGALTLDHTEAARLVREGGLTPEEARLSPLSHRLTNALGWPTDLVVDLVPGAEELGALDEDCCLLVCSDGLYTMVSEADIHAALLETPTLEEACRTLVSLALERGSSDNVSVAAVEVGHRLRSA
jgi:serine/threonine protein phosphatase PrpC